MTLSTLPWPSATTKPVVSPSGWPGTYTCALRGIEVAPPLGRVRLVEHARPRGRGRGPDRRSSGRDRRRRASTTSSSRCRCSTECSALARERERPPACSARAAPPAPGSAAASRTRCSRDTSWRCGSPHSPVWAPRSSERQEAVGLQALGDGPRDAAAVEEVRAPRRRGRAACARDRAARTARPAPAAGRRAGRRGATPGRGCPARTRRCAWLRSDVIGKPRSA